MPYWHIHNISSLSIILDSRTSLSQIMQNAHRSKDQLQHHNVTAKASLILQHCCSQATQRTKLCSLHQPNSSQSVSSAATSKRASMAKLRMARLHYNHRLLSKMTMPETTERTADTHSERNVESPKPKQGAGTHSEPDNCTLYADHSSGCIQ